MNYLRPQLLEQLAGAYALGTLRGPARARFDRLCQHNSAASAAVHRWEDRLMSLLPVLAPVVPSPQVWARIAQRIQSRTVDSKRGTGWWGWMAAGALALSLVVGIAIRLLNPPPQIVAALGEDRSHPLWSVARSGDSGSLTIRALQDVRGNAQRAYELWALPRDGKPPVSLGLLPRTGGVERTLSAAQRLALLASSKVAVSLEPPGGSPTGQPTGPVLYVADVGQTG